MGWHPSQGKRADVESLKEAFDVCGRIGELAESAVKGVNKWTNRRNASLRG
jgi:hypothetical protein